MMIESLRRSLKSRVTLATLAIFVLSLWALGFFAARMLLADIERMVGEQQFSAASLVAANVNQEMQTRMSALEQLAARIDRNLLDKHDLLQADLEDRPVLRMLFNGGFFVTDAAGTATASVPLSAQRAGINYMFRNHVAGALREGRATVSEVAIGQQLRVPVVSLAVPIRNAQAQVVGSLVGVVNLGSDNFLDKITANPYGRTGGYVIVSQQQRMVIMATDKRRIMEQLPAAGVNPLIDRLIQGFEGSAVFVNPKGVEVLTSAKGVPLTRWYVAAALPTAEAFAPVRDMQRRMLLATLLLTLLAGGLVWLMLRRQLAPIKAAADALNARSGAAPVAEPLPNTAQDEIGRLIDGFNQLLATLRVNEARLGTIAAITSDLVYSCRRGDDGLFHVDWMSGNAEPVFGVGTGELIARGCWRPFVVEQDRPLFAQAVTDLQPGQSGEQVIRIARQDGSVRWLQSIARVEADAAHAGGHHLVGALRDITERVQAEQERERLVSILGATTDIVSMADPQGRILYFNERGLALLGVGPGQPMPDEIARVHPRWAADLVLGEGVPAAIRDGIWSGETAVLGAGGQEIPVSQVILSHKDLQGRLQYLSTIMRDIRAIRATEQALRESEQRFRSLAENSADWIWALDLNGRHVFSNANTVAILGYRVEEFLALDPATLVHPDDLESFAATFAAARAARKGWRNVVIRWRHQDGGYRLLESSAAAILDEQGELRGFQGVDRDITERVRADQERQRLASILEATSDIVSMADPQGNLIYMNRRGRTLLGIAPEGALPQVVPRVHPQWAADRILRQGLPTAIAEGSWSGETAVLDTQGQEIPVSQVILGHKDEQGHLLFLSTMMRDIRPIRAAEQAVRDSEQRLRLALEAASQGLYDLDLSTGEAQVSPEYATMLGYDPATFKETNAAWRERLHPDDQAAVSKAYEDYLAGRLPEYRVEFRQRTRDGGWKWVLSLGKIQQWSADGRPLRMLGTHTDIDATKAAEAALRELNAILEARVAQRTSELHALNQSLEGFVYSVSHDLKAPLRGIEGYSRLLEKEYADRLDDEGRLFVGNIRAGVARMGQLIDDLLAYSRMERKALAHTALDPAPLVEQLLAERRAALAEHGIAIHVALAGSRVLADPDGLSMVLRNLLENAIKFSAKVASPRIEIGSRSEADSVVLWMRDNGIGFEAKYHDRIFEIFQRLHRLEDYPGTGIGLALVKKAMQRMGGRAWAESAPGQGATFYLSLPRAAAGPA